MKIYSYNVNGIRAAVKKGFLDWIEEEKPDVLCLQETKTQSDQFEEVFKDFKGYYRIHHHAVKKGYSGVAILSKKEPDNIVVGMDHSKYDDEGRVLRADFGDLSVICVYIPSGTTGGIRQDFKMEFLADFEKFVLHQKEERPNLIISGDYNICHKPIDINHPERHKKSSGFLPEERAWMDKFVGLGFVDTFREFNTEPEQYSWWSYRANSRAKNLGWRIDYHMAGENLKDELESAAILKNVFHSDHCPVVVKIK